MIWTLLIIYGFGAGVVFTSTRHQAAEGANRVGVYLACSVMALIWPLLLTNFVITNYRQRALSHG